MGGRPLVRSHVIPGRSSGIRLVWRGLTFLRFMSKVLLPDEFIELTHAKRTACLSALDMWREAWDGAITILL